MVCAEGAFNPYAPPSATLVPANLKIPGKDVYDISGSLRELLCEAAKFPLRRDNLSVMIVGTIIVTAMAIGVIVPIFGWVACIGGCCYLAAYYFEIIQHTVNGKFEAPPWPDWTSYWDDLVIPGAQMIGIALVSSLPVFAAVWCQLDEESDFHLLMLFAASILQWIYFPMATLAVICHGTVWASLPHRVLPALIRCMPGYLMCAAAFGLAEMLRVWTGDALEMNVFLGWAFSWVIFIYVMVVQARLTGLIYLRYRAKIGWV